MQISRSTFYLKMVTLGGKLGVKHDFHNVFSQRISVAFLSNIKWAVVKLAGHSSN